MISFRLIHQNIAQRFLFSRLLNSVFRETQLSYRSDYRISNSVTVDFTKLWVSSEYCTDASGISQDILAKKGKSSIKYTVQLRFL